MSANSMSNYKYKPSNWKFEFFTTSLIIDCLNLSKHEPAPAHYCTPPLLSSCVKSMISCKPVGRICRRGLDGCQMCMLACISIQDQGDPCKTRVVWGHAPPGKFQKLDVLRLLLRPFWDRNRAIVATWLAEYCIQFWLSTYAFAKPADFEFP